MAVCSIAKLYGKSTTQFISTSTRNRSEITRSRDISKVNSYITSNNTLKTSLATFCKGTGLRRGEFNCLTGDKLIKQNGNYYIKINSGSKGGKQRLAPVIGKPQEVKAIVTLMRQAGDNKVFQNIPKNAPIHAFRAMYAQSVYMAHARPIQSLPANKYNSGIKQWYKEDAYYCRGDMKGIILDKQAMKITSEALGHNRICVIAEHYLYGLN